jgi:hypothetical protein
MSPEAREHSLDELARGLASGNLSRAKALKLMGATLVGGALASIPGIAWAKPNKPEGAKCNHNHQCASGQCGVDGRCLGGSTCDGQICGELCCTADESCYVGLPSGGTICCSNDPFCVGAATAAGQAVCIAGPISCDDPICNTDADCSPGELCVQTFGCAVEGNRCASPC